jgi:hypothetical protein
MGIRAAQMVLIGTWLLAGCSTFSVNVDYDQKEDFSRLRSYGWLATGAPTTGDPRIDNSLLDSRIRKATEQELASKGYTSTPKESADFLVAYQVMLKDKVDLTTVYGGYGYRYGWSGVPTQTFATQYQEGTLLLDILDPRTKTIVWRGSASARIEESTTPEEREQRVRKAVQAILEKFPPKGVAN